MAKDPTVKIKFDHREVTKGVKVVNSSLNKMDDKAEAAAGKFKELKTSMTQAGKEAITLSRRSGAASTQMGKLSGSIDTLVNGLRDQIKELNKSAKTINKNVSSFDKLETALSKNTKAVKKHGDAYKVLKKDMNSAASSGVSLRGIIATIVSVEALKFLISYADAWQKLTNNIRIFAKSEEDLISTRKRLFEIAQKTRTELSAQAALYNRLKIAQTDLGISEAGILKVTEAVGYALGITATSALEARGALIQLGQAFGSGIVRAEEFNAINEGTPKIMQSVAKGLGLTRSQLRGLVLEGKITSDVFANSLLSMADSLENEFSRVNQTIGQSFTNIRSTLTKFIGELGDATGVYQDFVDVLMGANNILLDHSDTLISLADQLLNISRTLLISGGVIIAVKQLRVAFIALNAAVVANPLVAAAVGIALASEQIAYAYDKIWGVAADNTKNISFQIDEVIRKRAELFAGDKDRKLSILSASDDFAPAAIKQVRVEIAKLNAKLIIANDLTKSGGLAPDKSTIDAYKTRKKYLEDYIAAEQSYAATLDKQQDTLVAKAKIVTAENAKKLKIQEELSKKRVAEALFYKENSKRIKDLTKQYQLVERFKKSGLKIDVDRSGLDEKQIAALDKMTSLLSNHSATISELNDLRKKSGKNAVDALATEENALRVVKMVGEEKEKQNSILKSQLKGDVAKSIRAMKLVESIRRSGVSDTPEGQKLIEGLERIISKGKESETILKKLGIPVKVYSDFDKLVTAWKKLNGEIEEAESKTLALLKTQVSKGVKGRKSEDKLSTFFTTTGIALDEKGISLLNESISVKKEGIAASIKFTKITGKESIASIALVKTLQERVSAYIDTKVAQRAMSDDILESSMTTYKFNVMLLKREGEARKNLHKLTDKETKDWVKNQEKNLHPLEQFIQSIEDPIIAVENVFVAAMQGMEDSLVNFVKTGKLEWKSLVSSIIEGLIRVEIQQSIIKPLSGAISGGGVSSFFSDIIGGNLFAKGGAFTNTIVDKPTMFASGGMIGGMGEAGPEAILPLSKTSSGNLGVEAKMAIPKITLNIENNGSGEVEAENVSQSIQGDEIILSVILNAANNNGSFGRAFNGSMSRWR